MVNQKVIVIQKCDNVSQISKHFASLRGAQEFESVYIIRNFGIASVSIEVFFRILSFETSADYICTNHVSDKSVDKITLQRVSRLQPSSCRSKSEKNRSIVTVVCPKVDSSAILKNPNDWEIVTTDKCSYNGTELLIINDLIPRINTEIVVFSLHPLSGYILNLINKIIENANSSTTPFEIRGNYIGKSDILLFSIPLKMLSEINVLAKSFETLFSLLKRMSCLCCVYNIKINKEVLKGCFNFQYGNLKEGLDTIKQPSTDGLFNLQPFFLKLPSNSVPVIEKECEAAASSPYQAVQYSVSDKNIVTLPLVLKTLRALCPNKSIVFTTDSRLQYLIALDLVGSQLNEMIVEVQNYNGESRVTLSPQPENRKKDNGGWSFGVITDGRIGKRVANHIASIEALKLEEYEILICGPYDGVVPENCRIISLPDSKRKNEIRAWITKKKNLIVKAASYENVMICHDRITFDPEWNNKIARFHQSFDVLVFPVRGKDDARYRVNDWERFNGTYLNPETFKLIPMPYDRWSPNAMVYGGAFAVKRTLFLKCPLDERLHWSEAEDVLQSEVYAINGYVVQLGRESILYSERARIKGYRDNILQRVLVLLIRYAIFGRTKNLLLQLKRRLL